MTGLWWILGVLVALSLLCLTRVGALFIFGETLTVKVRLGPFRIQVLPQKEKKKAKKEPTKARKTTEATPKKPFSKPGLTDIRDAVKALWPPLKQALRQTCRGVRIAPLELSLCLGGAAEPADAAQRYGELQGILWSGMPVLEELLVIPNPQIHMDVDFEREETMRKGRVGLSARIGTLLRIGWTLAVPALKWFLTYRKNHQIIRKDESDGNGKEKPAA